MRTAFFLMAGLLWSASAYAQTPRSEVCRKGSDERIIEIAAPGNVGAACDVVYVRDGGANVTVPYNANVNSNFCRARAAELAATLIADGFDCTAAAADEIEAALAGGPASSVEGAPASQIAELAAPATSAEAIAPTPAASVATASDLPLDEQLDKLEQPAAIASADPVMTAPGDVGAPVILAAAAGPIDYHAPRPSRSTGAGRLVGVQPSLDGVVDETVVASAEPVKVAPAPVAGIAPRAAEDVIRGVIAATAAAWNEGNLDAFMAGYADTPDVTMIRDAAATTGWGPVKQNYEQEAAVAGEMGRLAFEGLDVKMTADDVATVFGRYSLSRASSTSKGVVTLVMRLAEGRWRIVHDTRIAGAAPKAVDALAEN